jgi:hypothetical protein
MAAIYRSEQSSGKLAETISNEQIADIVSGVIADKCSFIISRDKNQGFVCDLLRAYQSSPSDRIFRSESQTKSTPRER